MNTNTRWLVVAFAEAVAIAALAWNVSGADANAPAIPVAVPTPAPLANPLPASTPDTAAATDERSTAPPTATTAPVPAEPAPALGTLVHGAVRTKDGTPRPRGWLQLSLNTAAAKEALASSSLDREQSEFAWPDIAAGDYTLRVRGEGLREAELAVVVAPGASATRVDVVVEPSWFVDVRLTTPDGGPLRDALKDLPELASPFGGGLQVVAWWQPIPDQLPLSDLRQSPLTVAKWSDAQGQRFGRGAGRQLRPGVAGTLEMPERRAAFVAALLKEVVLARAALAADQSELELVVDPTRLRGSLATVRLQVVDADGSPRADAKVGIHTAQSWSQPSPVDGEGRFEKSGCVPGRYQLSVTTENHGLPSLTIDLMPGGVTDLGALKLPKTREIRFAITDAPTTDKLRLSLLSLDAPSHPALRPDLQRLAVNGGTARAVVTEGRHRLQVSGAGGAVLEFDTRSVGDAPIPVTLQPEAAIRFDPSKAEMPVRLAIARPDGAVLLDRWITWRSPWQHDLLPGTYTITVQPLVGAARSEVLTVGASGVDVTL